jgi:hypothetical protein
MFYLQLVPALFFLSPIVDGGKGEVDVYRSKDQDHNDNYRYPFFGSNIPA